MTSTELVPVRTIANAALVPFVRSVLQSCGMGYFIRNETAQELVGWGRLGTGFNIATGAPLVTVEAARAEEARELLAAIDNAEAPQVDVGDAWIEAGPDAWLVKGDGILFRPRTWLVAATLVVALFAAWKVSSSPWFRGLIHGTTAVILEADADSAVRNELDLAMARLAHEFRDGQVPYGSMHVTDGRAIEIRGIETDLDAHVQTVSDTLLPDWSRRRVGSGAWRFEPTPVTREKMIDRALESTLAEMRRQWGTTLIGIEEGPSGSSRVQVSMPGRIDGEGVRERFSEPAMLEVRAVRYPNDVDPFSAWGPQDTRERAMAQFGGRLPEGVELLPERHSDSTVYWPVSNVSIIVGHDLVDAAVITDGFGDAGVMFQLSPEGGRRLAAATLEMIGRRAVLVLRSPDEARVLSSPVIQDVIRSYGRIQGGFTVKEAEDLAALLRAGARTLPLTPVESWTDREERPSGSL